MRFVDSCFAPAMLLRILMASTQKRKIALALRLLNFAILRGMLLPRKQPIPKYLRASRQRSKPDEVRCEKKFDLLSVSHSRWTWCSGCTPCPEVQHKS